MDDNNPIQNVETFGEKVSRLLKSKTYLELADPITSKACKEFIDELNNYQSPEIYKLDVSDSLAFAVDALNKCGMSANDVRESLGMLAIASKDAGIVINKEGIK